MARKKQTQDSTRDIVASKSAPSDRTKAAIKAAEVSNLKRPMRVGVNLICDPDGSMRAESPHSDEAGNSYLLHEAFGTSSNNFASASLAALELMTRTRGTGAAQGPAGLDAGLALMGAIDPQNELEAALAMQMVGCHSLSIEMIGRARHTDVAERVVQYGNLAIKLQRTFTAQVEALARLRGKGQQTVRVEHVNVAPGAQAIVGNVHHYGRGGRGARRKRRSITCSRKS